MKEDPVVAVERLKKTIPHSDSEPSPKESESKRCAYVRIDDERCQFEEALHDLVEFDGRHWCRFHLPMQDGQGNDSPKATWDEATIEAFNDAIFALIEKARMQNTEADFEGVIFPGPISFEQFTTDNPLPGVSFSWATFSNVTNFVGATFSHVAWFNEATFSREAEFDKATFSSEVWFERAMFSNVTKFTGATFSRGAWFNEATFGVSGNAVFTGATFFRDANFIEAKFRSDASFNEATFGGPVNFTRATFRGDTDFSCSPNLWLPSRASPDKALQCDSFDWVSFADAEFDGEAAFTNRKFTHPANFSGGYFTVAPEFYGCLLHQGTTFRERKFLDRGKKNPDAVMAYRILKLPMESTRDRVNEAMFFALEQEAMRKSRQAPPLVRCLSLLYAIGSRYGQSIGLPLLWLGITTLIAFVVYAYLQYGVGITDWPHLLSEAYLRKSDALKTLWDIVRASLEPIFKPFGAFNSENPPRPRVQLLMLLQSLLSLIWVALFLLAVRRRFKLD